MKHTSENIQKVVEYEIGSMSFQELWESWKCLRHNELLDNEEDFHQACREAGFEADECHNCGAELPEIDENGEARCPECKALHTLMNESEA